MFLERIIDSQSECPPIVWNTLLELSLRDDVGEVDAGVCVCVCVCVSLCDSLFLPLLPPSSRSLSHSLVSLSPSFPLSLRRIRVHGDVLVRVHEEILQGLSKSCTFTYPDPEQSGGAANPLGGAAF